MSDNPTSATDSNDAPSSSVTDTGVSTSQDTAAPTPNTSPSASETPDSTSPSSSDSRQSDREGLLAAVRAVVPPTDAPPAAPSEEAADTGEQTEKAPDQAAASGDQKPPAPDEPLDLNAPDPSEAELKKLRPETRKRFERLLAQRNLARTELEQVRPEITQHRELQGYLAQHQLAPDDVNALLAVGAALRAGNYQAFLEGVTPYVMAAQEAVGLRIARDLQSQVDDGTISEEAAREMTRTRHRAAQAESRLTQQSQQHQVETTQRSVAEIRSAVERWEANIRTRDPDYTHKANAVRRFSQALLQERGIPTTPEQAVALTQAAYDEATRELLRMRPPPQATRPSPSGVHGPNGSGTAPPQPRTMKEAALNALAQMSRTG